MNVDLMDKAKRTRVNGRKSAMPLEGSYSTAPIGRSKPLAWVGLPNKDAIASTDAVGELWGHRADKIGGIAFNDQRRTLKNRRRLRTRMIPRQPFRPRRHELKQAASFNAQRRLATSRPSGYLSL